MNEILDSYHSSAPGDMPSYDGIRVVASFEELVTTPFQGVVNAMVWPRTLPGDFAEIANALPAGEGITTVEEDELLALTLNHAGRIARDILLADLALLRSADLAPVLDVIYPHQRPTPEGVIPTDVYSYHADSATAPADTYLCTYTGACSEALRHDQVIPRVNDPATRAALLAEYGGQDDADFREFLTENFYDLHYLPTPNAQPYLFGQHHLWRVSIAYPGCPVPPCVHRAPLTLPGMPRRLLLLS
jgi:hypothetical protein